MMKKDYEVIKSKLITEYDENNEKFNKLKEKVQNLERNSIEIRVATKLAMIVLWIPLAIIGIDIYLEHVGNIIPFSSLLPGGVSILMGLGMDQFLNKNSHITDKMTQGSISKTIIENMEELDRALLEKARLHYRNQFLKKLIIEIETKEQSLQATPIKCDNVAKKEDGRSQLEIENSVHKMELNLNKALQKLDIDSNRWALKEVSKISRDTKESIKNIFAISLIGFAIPLLIYIYPNAWINPNSTNIGSILSSLLIGEIVGILFGIKRNQYYNKVFKKLNQELGEYAISEQSDDRMDRIYDEQLNDALMDACVKKMQLEEEKRKLEAKILTETSQIKKEIPFSYKANFQEKEQNLTSEVVSQLSLTPEKDNRLVKRRVKKETNNHSE